MRGLALIAWPALAGCDLVFDLDPDSGPRCSAISMFADDFTDDMLPSWRRFTYPASSGVGIAVDMENRLEIGTASSGAGGLAAPTYFDLRNGGISVDVELIGGGLMAGDDSFAAFELVSTIETPGMPADRLTMIVTGGKLSALRHEDGMQRLVGEAMYDPVEHRRWRITQAGTTTTWSVARRSGTFEPFQQFEDLAITHVSPLLGIGCTPAGCAARFDNVGDNGKPASGQACPANGQRDDFSSDQLDTSKWRAFGDSCTWTQAGGRLRAAYQGVVGTCILDTSSILDLTEGALAIEIVDLPDGIERFTFSAFELDDHEIRFERSGGNLIARDGDDALPEFASRPYNAAMQRWWRFRGTPNGVVLEVSPDGADWSFLAQTNLGALDRIRFRIGINNGPAGDVVLDNVNISP